MFDKPSPERATSPRVAGLIAQMSLDEKLAQLVGYWADKGDDAVAPMADQVRNTVDLDTASAHGIGHLTRVYGTFPVDPRERAHWLWEQQRRLVAQTRLGIPAIVHEEALTGLAAWTAATYPTPLAWGASFDPALVQRMAARIGESMRALGIHQALAPVLDVIVDPRWGRVDECIAEDPHVVAAIGTAYVRGIQSAGVHATLKHFAGYSASQAGRNHAPVRVGPRFVADVLLPPFEAAVRLGGARSIMNSYAEIDGVPVAADPRMLTTLLREDWGFDGVVVADYFAVGFLHTMHRVAADLGEAAALALRAGIDVELPTGDAYLAPLREWLRQHPGDLALVERAVARVLAQKEELGLLDADFSKAPDPAPLDEPRDRELARRLAEESIVLLRNDGVLPLPAHGGTIAVCGPNADAVEALMGCYSFTNHVLAHHPEVPMGLRMSTIADALADALPGWTLTRAAGCAVEPDASDDDAIARAVGDADAADVAIVVVGDRAGLFGRGTVGEGNDVDDLSLPGRQAELVERVAATGTPTVVVVVSGRPYALGAMLTPQSRVAAVVQAFFPGEEGAEAIASILAGRTEPSGRLPVSMPRSAGSQPFSYLHPPLGGPTEVSSADSTPALPFGFGLTYTSFAHEALRAADTPADGMLRADVVVTNTGSRAGTDVVQLYAHDEYASVTRPIAQLVGFQRVSLQPGESATVTFEVPTERLAFTAADGARVVEPGALELWVGTSCADKETTARLSLTGGRHVLTGTAPREGSETVALR